jgi:protein regulator of cytokinesis 1
MREREHVALSKELGIYINQESRANKMASLTILELDKELRDDVQQLKALKEERMREVLKLKALDEKLCQAIKMEPIYVPTKVVPTDEQLETLKQHIRVMEALKNQRFEKFTELKAEILNLYEQLETEPNTSFGREVVCEEDEAFVLSSINLDHVETMLLGLRNQLSSNIKLAETSNLFEKLEISGKDAFLTAHKGYSKMVIEELEFKLKELEVLKLQHLEEFIL